jgi:ABC-type transporter MlaC component
MKAIRLLSLLLALAALTGSAAAQATPATSPTDFVRSKVDEVISIVNRPATRGTPAFAQRQEDLKSAVRGFLDYTELCRRALGDHWNERTPEQQQAFVDLLTRLIETNYAVKLGEESVDTSYAVSYDGETVRGDNAEVSGTVTYQNETVAVEIMLLRRDTGWVVWDVVTDDVSIQETYAESFDEIISEDGWDELTRRLTDRLNDLQQQLAEQNGQAQPSTP